VKGHIRPRGKGVWAIVLDLERGPDGKRKQKWHTFHGPKKDAEREMARLLHSLNTGAYVPPTKETLGEFLEAWLRDYAALRVSPKTLQAHTSWVRSQIKPRLGSVRLDQLTSAAIQQFYVQLLGSGHRSKQGGLSASSIKTMHHILRCALETAVKQGRLSKNPCAAVETPRMERREMSILSAADLIALIDAARGTRLHAPILIAVCTGMRRGEVLALRWQDVDLDRGILRVSRSLEQTTGRLRWKEPKTGRARAITIPQLLVDELRRHRGRQAEHRLQIGPAWENNDLVIAQDDGTPMSPNALTNAFVRLVATAGVPRIRLHDLRHSAATLLLSRGVNVKVIAEMLGHSTPTLTLSTYAHCVETMQQTAADQLQAVFASEFDARERREMEG
jgi:integrase